MPIRSAHATSASGQCSFNAMTLLMIINANGMRQRFKLKFGFWSFRSQRMGLSGLSWCCCRMISKIHYFIG